MADSPAPTNGHTRWKARRERDKQRMVLMQQKRTRRSQNKTKGGDDPKSRDGGKR